MFSNYRIIPSACLTVMVMAFSLQAPAASDESVLENGEVRDAIALFDAWLELRVEREELPSVAVGVVLGESLLWSKAYGYADLASRRPATTETAYRVASITKLFTSTAIMQLRDAGKLRLDEPVADYVDWFRLDDRHAETGSVTIRQLMTHSSGLARELEGQYWDGGKLLERDEFIARFQETPSAKGREETYKYSNVAFAILGSVIESASGESYDDYITGHILKPLGMSGTQIRPASDMATLATGYEFRVVGQPRAAAPFTDSKAFAAAANMATSVVDLARFVSSQFETTPEAGRVLAPLTLRETHRVHWLADDWAFGLGLSWFVTRKDNRTVISHGGSVPGFRTRVMAAPADEFGLIVLTNSGDSDVGKLSNQAWTMLASAVIGAAKKDESKAEPDSSWTSLVGRYRGFDGEVLRVMVIADELALVNPGQDDPLDGRIRLEHVEDQTYMMLDKWQAGEPIRFEVDDEGRAVRIVMPGYSLDRLD